MVRLRCAGGWPGLQYGDGRAAASGLGDLTAGRADQRRLGDGADDSRQRAAVRDRDGDADVEHLTGLQVRCRERETLLREREAVAGRGRGRDEITAARRSVVVRKV